VPDVLKFGILNLLGPSGPVQAYTGIALPVLFHYYELKPEDCVSGPRTLNLQLSLAKLSSYLAYKLEDERRRNVIGGSSHVILVLGYTATISENDFTQSVKIIARFKHENPGNETLIQ